MIRTRIPRWRHIIIPQFFRAVKMIWEPLNKFGSTEWFGTRWIFWDLWMSSDPLNELGTTEWFSTCWKGFDPLIGTRLIHWDWRNKVGSVEWFETHWMSLWHYTRSIRSVTMKHISGSPRMEVRGMISLSSVTERNISSVCQMVAPFGRMWLDIGSEYRNIQ